MTNPFQAFNISDDQQNFTAVEQKVKRTHHEKRIYKQQQQATKVTNNQTNQVVITEPLPERIRENAKQVRNTRAPPTPQSKKLGDGHYLDRRSGTGRTDKPRKEGGGWGGIGNIKDQFKTDKYLKQTTEEKPQTQTPTEGEQKEQAVVQTKPEQPQAITLEQYYKNKGVEINNTFEKKVPAKRGEINAQWIKKEKLTVIQSKEDKKNSERNAQNIVKFTSSRVGLDQNLQSLGLFGKKVVVKQEEKREYKGDKGDKGKGGKKRQVVIQEEDFPTL